MADTFLDPAAGGMTFDGPAPTYSTGHAPSSFNQGGGILDGLSNLAGGALGMIPGLGGMGMPSFQGGNAGPAVGESGDIAGATPSPFAWSAPVSFVGGDGTASSESRPNADASNAGGGGPLPAGGYFKWAALGAGLLAVALVARR